MDKYLKEIHAIDADDWHIENGNEIRGIEGSLICTVDCDENGEYEEIDKIRAAILLSYAPQMFKLLRAIALKECGDLVGYESVSDAGVALAYVLTERIIGRCNNLYGDLH